jgi:parallel beta-helix repeat protein
MKKQTMLTSLVCLLLIGGALTFLPLQVTQADSGFANNVTYIESCGASSSADGETIVVTSDIQQTESWICIEISHEDVTVDCQGYVLSAPQPAGLINGIRILESGNNATVRNCTFAGYWWMGISSRGNSGLIEHNEFIDGGFGIVLSDSDGNELRHNKVIGNTWEGIVLSLSNENSIHHNQAQGVRGAGIAINSYSNFNDLSHNVTHENGVGIALRNPSSNNSVFKNRGNSNRGAGISLMESYENDVAGNTTNNNYIGIEEIGEDLNNIYGENVCKANETLDSNIDGACK